MCLMALSVNARVLDFGRLWFGFWVLLTRGLRWAFLADLVDFEFGCCWRVDII